METRRAITTSSTGLACLGLAIAVGYLLLHAAFDALVLVVWGFPAGQLPVWQSDLAWYDFVNAVIIGYLPAAQAIARRSVVRDLDEMRSGLRCDDAEFEAITEAATSSGGAIARAVSLSGLVVGALLTFRDPSMSGGAAASASDPWFVWALGRSMLTVWLITRFSIYDFRVTRLYLALGRDAVRIDLLDVGALAPFARRGQRSALTWVIFSSIFSLYWLGSLASRGNLPLLVVVLSMATFAFVGPLAALRQKIQAEKLAELGRLREQIRDAQRRTDAGVDSPRLGNLIGYYQLIESAREWPVDAANLLKFIGYLLLGLGSWLGGAVVERLLDSAIRG
jgi:hypothetical protein